MNNSRTPRHRICAIPRSRGEFHLDLSGDFKALKTVKHLTDLMRPMGYYERITLDFSDVSHVEAVELYRLFSELATAPHFNHIEIRIEGLQFNYLDAGMGRVDFVKDQG